MSRARIVTVITAIGLSVALTAVGCTKKGGSSSESQSNEGDGKNKTQKVAFVPKLQGIPYFEAMNTGGKKAAKEHDNIKWLYKGPTEDDAAKQANIVRSYIQQEVDTIVVAPNDPDSMKPVLKKAKDKGIHVMTADTDAPDSVRQAFIQQVSSTDMGKELTKQLMKAMGGKGEYAIVSCGETAENLNSWIKTQKKSAKKNYPKAKLVDVVYAGEDQAKAKKMATDLMSSHPELKGIVGECTSSAPGVAQAVKSAGKIGKVSTVGAGTPKAMKPYLKDGSASSEVLWDVEDLGYLAAWAGAHVASGKDFKPKNEVNDKLSSVKWNADKKKLLLGDPLVITKKNAGKFNY